MTRYAGFLGAALGAALLTGCVEQRFVVESDPPGAIVYLNGTPIGATPCDASFVYYGAYDLTLVKPGYQTLHVHEPIPAPWYEYFPLDFVSENVVPCRIHDVRRLRYALAPAKTPSADQVLPKSENLRNRGKALEPAPDTDGEAPKPPPVTASP